MGITRPRPDGGVKIDVLGGYHSVSDSGLLLFLGYSTIGYYNVTISLTLEKFYCYRLIKWLVFFLMRTRRIAYKNP